MKLRNDRKKKEKKTESINRVLIGTNEQRRRHDPMFGLRRFVG